ncbi:MAG: acyl carrier protein, partial [Planctomycetota bacterium]
SPEDVLTNSEYVVDGKVNDAGIAQLKERMPWADFTNFEENRSVQQFANVLTVQDLVNFVKTKL